MTIRKTACNTQHAIKETKHRVKVFCACFDYCFVHAHFLKPNLECINLKERKDLQHPVLVKKHLHGHLLVHFL